MSPTDVLVMGAAGVSLAELDALAEACKQPGAMIPHHVAASIARDERERRRVSTNLRHALHGYPLGRPRPW